MLSSRDEKLMKSYLKGKEGAMVVAPRAMFFSATPKSLAHTCFHKGILFHWSNDNYYFQEITK